jgi:hypothetical protein
LEVCVGAGPAFVDLNIAAINPAQSLKPLTAALTDIKTPGIYNRRTLGDLLLPAYFAVWRISSVAVRRYWHEQAATQ